MRKSILTIVVMLAVSLHAQGLRRVSDADARAMVEQIGRVASSVRTLEGDFTQVKSLRFLNDKMTSQGRMYYDATGKLRWEYVRPYTYVFILNGQKVYIHSSRGSQTIDVRQSRLFQGIAQVMMNSVTGKNLSANSDFSTVLYTLGDEWVAELTPRKKEMKQMFKTIRLHFDSASQKVSKVEMTEQSGDLTVITLKNVKTNGKIDAHLFAGR
jgi:outer membrane lipoprotein-sorting protein